MGVTTLSSGGKKCRARSKTVIEHYTDSHYSGGLITERAELKPIVRSISLQPSNFYDLLKYRHDKKLIWCGVMKNWLGTRLK